MSAVKRTSPLVVLATGQRGHGAQAVLILVDKGDARILTGDGELICRLTWPTQPMQRSDNGMVEP